MGTLHTSVVRGKEVFSFEYEKAWLSSAYAQVLDPELHLYTEPQYLAGEEKNNFGVFLDSSGPVEEPDAPTRGCNGSQRRPAGATPAGERLPAGGVRNGHRMGALRFKQALDGPFLNNSRGKAITPWTAFREI
ncbi:hypothetical protein GCM10011323_32230 [Pontibacter amylolyticus]|uniref:HipA N-terminal subdomain 1 domain-containing protein n=2 Tax=Pontibacter amylolyticus TaxID=1424080 RepID=A0ABQ1WDA7_9BACT|nr:hypothetical protein GCM10011323_32230 [Pontibacter amylolyticus]